jgi:DNA-binding winged helix-turn-helix (wHTH) protein
MKKAVTWRDPQLTRLFLQFRVRLLVNSVSQSPQGLRFGIFEIDLEAREVRKSGLRVKLQEQPFKILVALVGRAGEVVTRDVLYSELSGHSTYDSKQALNNAIQKIRDVLSDSPENARFIETVPGRGYRFLPQVEVIYKPSIRRDWILTAEDERSESPTVELKAASVPDTAPASVETSGVEPSLFRNFFLLFGTTPYRRWEIMHLRMALWCLLLAYLGLRFMAYTSDVWGLVLFYLELSCIATLLICLGFLLYTGTSDPGGLSREVRRMAPWIRWLTITLTSVMWVMAGAVVVSHPTLAAFLVVCSTAGSIKYLLFKAAFDRAAFPEIEK